MSVRSEVIAQVSHEFVQGERLIEIAAVQIKGGQKEALAKSAIGTVAGQLLLAAITGNTFGIQSTFSAPAGFVLVTTERVAVLDRKLRRGRRNVVFLAPRLAVDAEQERHLLTRVDILDRSDWRSVIALNFGVRRRSAHRIVAAIKQGTAASTLY